MASMRTAASPRRPGSVALVAATLWVGITLLLLSPALTETGLDRGSPDSAWPQFRGPDRSGVVERAPLADSWPEGGPPEVWRRELGPAFSAISVVGDRLYTLFSDGDGADGESEAKEYAGAFDPRTGEELWRRALGPTFVNEFGNGPRSTPTLDSGTLFALGSMGDLYALAAENGEVRWHVSLGETFGARPSRWGFSTSVLVDGDLLLVESGGKEGKAVAGLDRATGETRWHFGDAADEHSYSSPIAVALGGERHYVVIAAGQAQGIDREGKTLWAHPWPAAFRQAIGVALKDQDDMAHMLPRLDAFLPGEAA